MDGGLMMPEASAKRAEVAEFLQFLINTDRINPHQATALQFERRTTGKGIEELLIARNFLTSSEVQQAMSEFDINILSASSEIRCEIPLEYVDEYKIVINSLQETQIIVSCEQDEASVQHLVESYYPQHKVRFIAWSRQAFDEFKARLESPVENASLPNVGGGIDIVSIVENQPENRLVDAILKFAVLVEASDIHFDPQLESYALFFRYNSSKVMVHQGSLDEYGKIKTTIKDRAGTDAAQVHRPQDGSFTMRVAGRNIDFRLSVMALGGGRESLALRILDSRNASRSLEDLGITDLMRWRQIFSYQNGIVLICGETGSGKTTTQMATIRELPYLERRVLSIEQPIEYRLPYITQIELDEAQGRSGAAVLRAGMRNDPDFLIVGEIRDYETAMLATNAAETGHMAFGTLHTGRVQASLNRLVGLGVEPFQLYPVIRGVLVQRLMKTLCLHCGGGSGCKHCLNTGYGGRTAINEMVGFADESEVREAIQTQDPYWPSVLDDAIYKYRMGITDWREVSRVFGSELDKPDTRRKETLDAVSEIRRLRDLENGSASAFVSMHHTPQPPIGAAQEEAESLSEEEIREEIEQLDAEFGIGSNAVELKGNNYAAPKADPPASNRNRL